MILFPKDFPDKLRSTILTSEVVGKKVKLKARGKDFQGLCPFHNEKTPSFTVNDLKGFYHCFGCSAHGDIISFVMKMQGLEFPDAIKQLADDFGIEIPQVKYEKFDEKKQEKVDRNYLIAEQIGKIFEENLSQSMADGARRYLAKRALSKEVIKKFHLGYTPASYDFLHKKLQSLGFSEDELLKSGVIAKNDQNKLYDKFRNRVIFPIFDKKNRVIAFGGRVLGEDLPKYLNSAETEIFRKNQTLYNINNARKAIFDKKYAIIVEGYMDVISLDANGIENVVAGLGTALSENHLTELFRLTDKIVICLDGDLAGIRAAKRVAEIALPIINAKKTLCFTFLPNAMDPDDFVRNYGAAALEKLLGDDAVSLSQALFEFTLIDLNLTKNSDISPENKAKIEENLLKKADLIKDGLSKKYFTQFFKNILFNLGRGNLAKNGKKSFKNDKNQEKIVQNHENFGNLVKKIYIKPNSNMADNLAKSIIAFIVKYPRLAHYSDENFDLASVAFLSPALTELKDKVIEIIDENVTINEKNLLLALENYGYNNYIVDIKGLIDGVFYGGFAVLENEVDKKMSLLLLKELLLQINEQYKQALAKIDEIDTHQTAIINQKIKEIFAYKHSLEQKILLLERDSS